MTAAAVKTLVFDTTCLSHFARSERLDVLGSLVVDQDCWTTSVVTEELHVGMASHPVLAAALKLDWLSVTQLDSADEIACFGKWIRWVCTGDRDRGEASVFAAAELLGGVAITDDRQALRFGRRHGATVHGTVWLLAWACRDGRLTETAAGNLIDALIGTGHRLPCTGSEFSSYARRRHLL